ncbi:BglG family transcription antiterminator [Staphylococcus argensis]|uniref:BglG family transcription antiterminator n=1 Tax=Staphylococcus argensis TaxID=1607738 RepID=UPI0011A0D2C9|nr:transcription antiterminator [Staphylococcus argensis]
MLLSKRERAITEMLLKHQDQYLTIYDIAQTLAVSSRTIHRELKSLEETLNQLDLTLERVVRKGLKLSGTPHAIKRLRQLIQEQTMTDLSEEEQQVIILYALIQAEDPIKQYSLAHEIGVSTQTLSKILDQLEQVLNNYQLKLQRKRGEGISLQGPESKKRELLSLWMVNDLNSTSVYSVIENHFVYQSLNQTQLSMVDMDKIFRVERLLMDYLDSLPYTLIESSYITLTVHIVLSIDRMQKNEYVSLEPKVYEEVRNTREFEVATALASRLEEIYEVTFTKAEITFITIHLRGAKRKNLPDEEAHDATLIHRFIQRVSIYAEMEFTELDTLTEGLKLHLIPAINRLRANIETYNPLTQMVKEKYPHLFHSVKLAVEETWSDLHFPDSEIAFLVLHFGGAIRREGQRELNVLVVCSSGIGTSRLLATRLEQTFPEITSTQQASVGDLAHMSFEKFDAIISTVNLDIEADYLTVNPLLPDTDIHLVAQFLKSQSDYAQTETRTEVPSNLWKPKQAAQTQLDTEQILKQVREGLQLLDRCEVEHVHVEDVVNYLTDSLYQREVINDRQSFSELLVARMEQDGYALAPYPLALPHLRSSLIQKSMLLLTLLEQPLELPNHNDTPIRYLINIFIADDPGLAQLVSHFTGELIHHLDEIDVLMSEPDKLISILKDQYVAYLKQILIME